MRFSYKHGPLSRLEYKNRVNNSLHLWSEAISLVEWISLDSNSKRSDHWGHSPGSDLSDKKSENSLHFWREWGRINMGEGQEVEFITCIENTWNWTHKYIPTLNKN